MKAWRTVGIVLLAILTAMVMVGVAALASSRIQVDDEQAVLNPFYTPEFPCRGDRAPSSGWSRSP